MTTEAITCHQRALEWVHFYAGGGAVFAGALAAALPIPGLASTGLVAAETTMIYWVAKIYGEDLGVKEVAVVATGLELGGLVLKIAAMEAANLVPVAGWVVKGVIAGSAIEGIGQLIVRHFDQKYPGKIYSRDPKVEAHGGRS